MTQKQPQIPAAPHPFISTILTLLLFTCVLVVYPVHYDSSVNWLKHSGYESLATAESLVDGKGFSNPFAMMETGPSACLPPVYPAFMAIILLCAPNEPSAFFALQWCATLMIALQVCLLPWLARRMGLGFYAGIVAAAFWVIARIPNWPVWEQNFLGLLISLAAYCMYKGLTGVFTRWQLLLCGLLWGVLILACPVAILALSAWLLLLHFKRTLPTSQKLILVLIPLAIVAPWLLRNFEEFHSFVFVRDNLGLEVELADNPCAAYSFDLTRDSGCFAEHHPNENVTEALKVLELGELAYNRQCMSQATAWIRNNPSTFFEMTVKRGISYWFPIAQRVTVLGRRDTELHTLLYDGVVSLTSLLALPGLVLLWRRNRAALNVLLIWLLFFPLVYYFVLYNDRYRIPILWAILLPAGYAVTELWRWLYKSVQSVGGRGRALPHS